MLTVYADSNDDQISDDPRRWTPAWVGLDRRLVPCDMLRLKSDFPMYKYKGSINNATGRPHTLPLHLKRLMRRISNGMRYATNVQTGRPTFSRIKPDAAGMIYFGPIWLAKIFLTNLSKSIMEFFCGLWKIWPWLISFPVLQSG